MKKKIIVYVAIMVLLLFSVCGCAKQPEKITPQKTEPQQTVQPEPTPQKQEEQVKTNSLQEALQLDADFGALYMEIGVWDYSLEQGYHFDSRNSEFCSMFLAYLEETKLQPIHKDMFDSEEKCIYFYFSEPNSERMGFSVNAKGQISINNGGYYESEEGYETLVGQLSPFMEESAKHYRICQMPDYMYSYTIWDAEGKVLGEETISNEPHLYYYDDGIVYRWSQGGNSIMARGSQFYDVIKGKVSPYYYGQTHTYGHLVSHMESMAVCVSDMFSGEELYRIDTFAYPLAQSVQSIESAYFTKDGKQIVVVYFDEDFNTHQQIFDLPETVLEYAK